MIIFKLTAQIASAILIFVASTFVTLYEGSSIVDDPWEWIYSTPFSHFFIGEVNQASDISKFDYFVYAAKFYPTYPIIMLSSTIYFSVLLGLIISKIKKRMSTVYFGVLSFIMFIMAIVLRNASTNGGEAIFFLILMYGIILLAFTFIKYIRSLKLNKINT